MGSQKSTWEVKGQHWKSAPLVFSERVIQARIGSFRNTRYINPQKGQSRFFGYKSSPLVHLLEHLILGNNFHPDPPPPETTLPLSWFSSLHHHLFLGFFQTWNLSKNLHDQIFGQNNFTHWKRVNRDYFCQQWTAKMHHYQWFGPLLVKIEQNLNSLTVMRKVYI